jgi:hypothetical protein
VPFRDAGKKREYDKQFGAGWRERNPDYNREWRKRHPGYDKEQNRRRMLKNPNYWKDYERKHPNRHTKLPEGGKGRNQRRPGKDIPLD